MPGREPPQGAAVPLPDTESSVQGETTVTGDVASVVKEVAASQVLTLKDFVLPVGFTPVKSCHRRVQGSHPLVALSHHSENLS